MNTIFLQNIIIIVLIFLYRKDLFNDIYLEYANLFNRLNIKNEILNKINNFYVKNFNENTISVHLRCWIDCDSRKCNFNINNFYHKINELNNIENTFFVCSDNKNICYEIKKKFGDKIIIYEDFDVSDYILSFIELFLLSKNNILIGSYISTFTELAYIINYNPKKQIFIL